MIIIMVRWKHLPRSDACSRRQRPHLRHLLHHHLQVVNAVIIIIIIFFITILITILGLSSSSSSPSSLSLSPSLGCHHHHLAQAGLRKSGLRVTLLIGNCHRGTMFAFMSFQFCAKKAIPKISSPPSTIHPFLMMMSLRSFDLLYDRQTETLAL